MRTLASNPTAQLRQVEIDQAIGQIDMLGKAGEVVQSWRIRTPRCTVGAAADCSVCLNLPNVAPLHATFIFGKKHTLLRANAPTSIANRSVREWLIDHPTEVTIASTRFVVHPTIGVTASVVSANNLIDQAARLCKEPTPIVASDSPHAASAQSPLAAEAILSPALSAETKTSVLAPSSLETIERLIQSLHEALDRMQETLGVTSKQANESLVQTVSHEIDEVGKRWFTTLSDQLNSQTDVQQHLIANLADQVTHRFGSIDEQLHRFAETNAQNQQSLQHLLEFAHADQANIEARFQQVLAQRNELIEAVQALQSEIVQAYQNSQANAASTSSTSDEAFTPTESRPSPITDEQLAASLELAQSQIQQYNQELQALYAERHLAQERIATLESQSQNHLYREPSTAPEFQASIQTSFETQPEAHSDQNYYAPAYDESTVDAYASQSSMPTYQEVELYQDASNIADSIAHYDHYSESAFVQEPITPADQALPPSYPAEFNSQDPSELTHSSAEKQQLPAWFLQDQNKEPIPVSQNDYHESLHVDDSSQALSSGSVQPHYDLDTPDVSSENLYTENTAPDYPYPIAEDHSDSPSAASHEELVDDSDSISERLQRMLKDAEGRRGPNKEGGEPRTSHRWSQRFGSPNSHPIPAEPTASQQPVHDEPISDSSYEIQQASQHAETESNPDEDPLLALRHLLRDPQPESENPHSNIDDYYRAASNYSASTHSADSVLQEESNVDKPSYADDSVVSQPSMEPELHSSVDNEEQLTADQELEKQTPIDHSPVAREESHVHGEEEESIEDYMQRLLQRVRGDAPPPIPSSVASPAAYSVQPNSAKPARSRTAPPIDSQVEPAETDINKPIAKPTTDQLFVPRQQSPEQRNDLNALRELANSNARRALTRSDIRRTNSAFFVKLTVTGISVTAAAALFMFNGFQLNPPFAGMVAAVIVALLWGYDCLNHFKRLKSAGNQAEQMRTEQVRGHQIQSDSSQKSPPPANAEGGQDDWRPTPA